jgi:protein-tyrosine phosphatase
VGRADVHFHLLPGVDDGPATLAESLDLARAALADGTATVVATPHVADVEIAELPERIRSLRRELAAAGLPLEVISGGELAPADVTALADDQLEAIAIGPPGARWALLEAPTQGATRAEVHAAAERLRSCGLDVVLGHPERSLWLLGTEGWDAIGVELERGSVLQVSAPSLLGFHGEAVREGAERMVSEAQEACVVASDAHSADRPPLLEAARAAIASLAGDRTAHGLVDVRPRRLVAAS